MTVQRNTPAFDTLVSLASQLGGTKTLSIDLGSKEALKLARLVATDRPFTSVTPALQQAVVRYARAAAPQLITSGGSVRTAAFWAVAAQAVKAHVLLRFRAQGADVDLKPLDAKYRAWKIAHGLDPRIGYRTGDLYRALSAAQWRIE